MPDNKVMDQLLHGEEKSVHGDKAYTRKRHNLLASDPACGPLVSFSSGSSSGSSTSGRLVTGVYSRTARR